MVYYVVGFVAGFSIGVVLALLHTMRTSKVRGSEVQQLEECWVGYAAHPEHPRSSSEPYLRLVKNATGESAE